MMSASVFRRDISEIIEKCKKSGLTDREIHKLFQGVHHHVRPKKSWPRCLCSWFLGVTVFSVIFFIVLTSLLNYEPTEYYLDHYLHDYAYPILRVTRLITLPLSKRFDLTGLYYRECLLENPLHEAERDCAACEDVSRIGAGYQIELPEVTRLPESQIDLQESWSRPTIWKDVVPHDVTMDDFLRVIEENIDVFQSTMKIFASENATIGSVEEFLNDRQDVLSQKDLYLLWQVRGSGALKSIRDLSWRPSDVETTPVMRIQVKGHAAAETVLPTAGEGDPSVLVTQAQGQTEVRFTSVRACRDQCKTSLSATLSAKDILSFNSMYWEMTTKPLGSEVNLLFVSFFY